MAPASNGDSLSQAPARLIALPWERLSWPARAAAALAVAALFGLVGYFAAAYHPNTAAPRGSAAEREIAAVFGLPESRDDIVSGDLLVERFYVIDAETGERYVADILKGRVQRVLESQDERGLVQYTLLLDLANLQRDRALLAAFVAEVASPQSDGTGFYLGLRLPVGLTDAFPLNYDGSLPQARVEFRGAKGEDIQNYLIEQKYEDVSQAPRLIGSGGFNYLLSNTEAFPYFRREFQISKAVFVSELVIVDMTGREQAAIYYRLLNRYPRSPR